MNHNNRIKKEPRKEYSDNEDVWTFRNGHKGDKLDRRKGYTKWGLKKDVEPIVHTRMNSGPRWK